MRKSILILVCVLGLLLASAAGAPVENVRQAAVAAALKSQGLAGRIYVECYKIWNVGDVYVPAVTTLNDLEEGNITPNLTVNYPDSPDNLPGDMSIPGVFREVWTGADSAGNQAEPKTRVNIVEGVPDIHPPVIGIECENN